MEGGSQADIFHFYTGWQQFYVDQGLVQEIDTSKLANWDQVPVEYQELGQIDGKQYFVPWDWGFTSILYNTEQVPEVTSWDALFNEEYAGHISMWNDGPGAVAVSSYINGWDETAITDEQLAQIEADWIAQKPLNAFYWSGEYTDLCPAVQDGTVWVAYAWQGCYATALADGDPVALRQPGRGSQLVGRPVRHQRRYRQPRAGPSSSSTTSWPRRAAATPSPSSTTAAPTATVMAAIDDPVLIEAFSLDDPTILETTNFTPTRHRRSSGTRGPRCGSGSRPNSAEPPAQAGCSRCWVGEERSRFSSDHRCCGSRSSSCCRSS